MKEKNRWREFFLFLLISLIFHLSILLITLNPRKKELLQRARKEKQPFQISLLEQTPTKQKPREKAKLGPQTHRAEKETRKKFIPMEGRGKGNVFSTQRPSSEMEKRKEEEKGEKKEKKIERNKLALLVPNSSKGKGKDPLTNKNILDDTLKAEETVNLNTTEFKYISYFSKLKRMVEMVWTYPYSAIVRGEEGTVTLRFTIESDGNLAGVEVLKTSGSPVLDSAAVKAVKDSSPYPPLPKSWKIKRLNVVGDFHYILGYRFVR